LGDLSSGIVTGLQQDSLGRLWILLTIKESQAGDPRGNRGDLVTNGAAREMGVQQSARLADHPFDREYDTIVRVIDPSTEQLITAARFDEVFGSFVGGGLVPHVVIAPGGAMRLEVLKLTLNPLNTPSGGGRP
jgi:hypothetical protein